MKPGEDHAYLGTLMSLKQEIENRLRTLQGHYEQLARRVPINRLNEGLLPENARDTEFLECLNNIMWETRDIESLINTAYARHGKAVHFLDTSLYRFWEETARPSWQAVRKIYADHHPDGWGEQLLMEAETLVVQARPRQDIAWTVRAALTYLDEMLDEDDERREEIFDFDGAHTLLESPLFQPDMWAENNRQLRPFVRRQTDAWFPKDVRVRIESLYHALLFGNWLASIALARAVLEYAILHRARDLQIDTTEPGDSRRTAGLSVLVTRSARVRPDLSEAMGYLVARGNEVMHPVRTPTRTEPDLREIAFKCVEKARSVVEKLYRHEEGGAN